MLPKNFSHRFFILSFDFAKIFLKGGAPKKDNESRQTL